MATYLFVGGLLLVGSSLGTILMTDDYADAGDKMLIFAFILGGMVGFVGGIGLVGDWLFW